MPKTGLKKGEWKDFFAYHKWMYVLVAAMVWLCTDILYSATEYRVPPERQVSFQMVTAFVETETGRLPEVAAKALEVGKEYDSTLEEVAFFNLAYNPYDDTDTYGGQKYMLMLGVAEGDIYMVPRGLMLNLVEQGYLLPLEGYIANGILDPGEVDLANVTFHESQELEDYDPDRTHVYAVPMANMNAMLESDIAFDNREYYMVLMGFSKNPDTSVVVMNSVIEQLTAPRPEWAQLPESTPAPEGTSVFDSTLQDAGFATPAPTRTAE